MRSCSCNLERVPRVRLPSNPESKAGVKLGEGKPENQNAAVIFCFNEAIQSIDMNQVRTSDRAHIPDSMTIKLYQHTTNDNSL